MNTLTLPLRKYDRARGRGTTRTLNTKKKEDGGQAATVVKKRVK